MLIYAKGYYYKLCRKGLLERGISVGKCFGNFKDLENEYMSKFSFPNANVHELLSEFKKLKAESVKKEIMKLKFEMENLGRTISNKKAEIQKKTDEFTYRKWSQYINEASLKFKKLFSDEINDLFNHLYRMDEKYEETLRQLISENLVTSNEILVNTMRNELLNEFQADDNEDVLFTEVLNASSASGNNDSGFNGSNDFETIDEIGNVDMAEFEDFIEKSFSLNNVFH